MTCSKKLHIIVGSYILYLTRKGRFRVYVYVLSDSHPAPSAYPVARLSTVRTPEWRHERPTPAGAPHFTLLPTSLMCVETSWRIEWREEKIKSISSHPSLAKNWGNFYDHWFLTKFYDKLVVIRGLKLVNKLSWCLIRIPGTWLQHSEKAVCILLVCCFVAPALIWVSQLRAGWLFIMYAN